MAAEERERKLVGAEESLARRRKEAEREHKAALADAQASVRRLQAGRLLILHVSVLCPEVYKRAPVCQPQIAYAAAVGQPAAA